MKPSFSQNDKRFILFAILLVIFLDFFNLGLIFPIFSSIIFEGDGGLLAQGSADAFMPAGVGWCRVYLFVQ